MTGIRGPVSVNRRPWTGVRAVAELQAGQPVRLDRLDRPIRPAPYPTPATDALKSRAADMPSPVGAASHPGDPMG